MHRPVPHTGWDRFGVSHIRVSGSRGRVRYRVRFGDGGCISAGPFKTYLVAFRHAHAHADKRSRAGRRSSPVGTERWLWQAGDLKKIADEARGGRR